MNINFAKTTIRAFLFVVTLLVLPATINAQDLSIPSIDVTATIDDAPIANGTWDVSHLNMNVARLEGLPWFGMGTNVVIAGHSEDTQGNPDIFYRLDQVNIGDSIYVNVDGQTLQYVVVEKRNVAVSDLSILYPTNDDRLTLFTCDTDSFVNNEYLRRDVVIAQRVG